MIKQFLQITIIAGILFGISACSNSTQVSDADLGNLTPAAGGLEDYMTSAEKFKCRKKRGNVVWKRNNTC